MPNNVAASNLDRRIACLGYFNPKGNDASGLLGESPNGVTNNIMAYIAQVATEQRMVLNVFGGDYPTEDGAEVVDYIDNMDLAEWHATALTFLSQAPGCHAVNLGTGEGYSVLNMVQSLEKASGRAVPHKIVDRRPDDLAVRCADPKKANERLNWRAAHTLDNLWTSIWHFQQSERSGLTS